MKVNCQDYRATMRLLFLKNKLGKGISDPEEQEEVKKMIKKLEELLDLE